jgi:hypothetical protein
MLVFHDQTQRCDAAPLSASVGASAPAGQALSPQIRVPLPPEAVPHLFQLRTALGRYRASGSAAELSAAFPAAGGVIGALQIPAGGRPDLEQLRRLAETLPEFGELLSSAAGEAERIVCAGTTGVWHRLGLRSAPPTWTPAERDAARMVFACACAPTMEVAPVRFQAGLRALAAPRFAQLLGRELAESEAAWTRALGDRYESVRHRCARRTAWRSHGLSDLLRGDEIARGAVARRLERWMADGGLVATLAAELEAAIVHARTPARFA